MIQAPSSPLIAVDLTEIFPEGFFNDAQTVVPLWTTHLTRDSRQVKSGSTFFALLGQQNPVQIVRYIQTALQQGAVAVLVDDALPAELLNSVLSSGHVFRVKHLADWLGIVAARFWNVQLQQYKPVQSKPLKIAAVTGTNGKTTISRIIAELLTLTGRPCAVMGTTGNGILPQLEPSTHTTLDALDLQAHLADYQRQGAQFAALEASSHGLAQGRLAGTPIKVAVFSNLTRDHLDYHGTFEEYAQAKARLFAFDALEFAILNADDGNATLMQNACSPKVNIWRYSMIDPHADLSVQHATYSIHGADLTLKTPYGSLLVHSPLLGRFNVANLLAAIGACLAFGVSLHELAQAIPQLVGPVGRMQVIADTADLGRLLLVDYAHTPDALTQVLASVRPHITGKIWLVFGCGGDRDTGKRPLMTQAASQAADELILTADNPRSERVQDILKDMLAGIADSRALHVIEDRRAAIRFAVKQASSDDAVIVAGKGHEDYQEINGTRHWFDDAFEVQAALNPVINKTHLNSAPLETSVMPVQLSSQSALDFTPERLAAATQGQWHGTMPPVLPLSQRICTDTRHVQAGDIFLALKGERFDAHDFVQTAIDAGAVALIVERILPGLIVPQLLVSSTRVTLGTLGAWRRAQHTTLKVVAITGSSGKTTTKQMLGAILQRQGSTLMTRGNLNNDLGVPMMLLELTPEHEFAVLELGANHVGEIAYTAALVKPQVAAVLNIGSAHMGEFGGREGIAHAKAEIYAALPSTGCAVLPMQGDFQTVLAAAAEPYQQLLFGEGGQVFASDIQLSAQHSRFTLHTPLGQAQVNLPFSGRHNIDNALAAAACATALQLHPADIAQGLAAAQTTKGRLHFSRYASHQFKFMPQTLAPELQCTIIDDTYNANPHSVLAAAQVLCKQSGTRFLILGDIAELGEAAATEHEQLGKKLAALPLDYVFSVGEFAQVSKQGFDAANLQPVGKSAAFTTQADLYAALKDTLQHTSTDTALLFKGSRSARMEDLITMLLADFSEAG